MKKITLNEAFKNININHSLKPIRSLFSHDQLNYKPDYQREYIWPPFKASYFLETILIHAEFPPIVIFARNGVYEVIDGRQRCETIHRFLKDELTLRASGLEKLWYLADKKFSQLGDLQERFESANIRVITIEFKSDHVDPATEELVKREFFRRYNLGISPLKKEEVYKAQYLQDEINMLFKRCFQQDAVFYDQVNEIFDHKAKNIELQMQSIRQLLVLHNIPINRFVDERDDIVNMYYDYLSFDHKGAENGRSILNEFRRKVTYLSKFKLLLDKEYGRTGGIVFEALYWGLSIAEAEHVKPEKLNSPVFKDRLVKFLAKHIKEFTVPRSNQSSAINTRYRSIAEFFASQLHIPFDKYLKNPEFIAAHKQRMTKYMQERVMPGLEKGHFSKATPTSWTVQTTLDRISKHQKFLIRPPYQRKETKNEVKASSLIESIIKGIRLHPIYVYIRKDDICEVIDGQQRLLSIVGFVGKSYLDEQGRMVRSIKHNFKLKLRSGLMQELHGMRFTDLPVSIQRQILDFDIDVIEIREDTNPHFKPESLFKRLNYKPFPIKEHSFEFWNAYVDSEIIKPIKAICQKNPWMYLRKNNNRMMNEELIVQLIYCTYATAKLPLTLSSIKEVIRFKTFSEKISLQTKSKSLITQALENETCRKEFLQAIRDFEVDFVSKLKVLTYHPDSINSDQTRGRQLDNLLHTSGALRTLISFHVLWVILRGIPIQTITNSRPAVKNKINKVFDILATSDSSEEFEKSITNAWTDLKAGILPIRSASVS